MPMKSEDTSLVVSTMHDGVEHTYRLYRDENTLNMLLREKKCRQIDIVDWTLDPSFDQDVITEMEKNDIFYAVCLDENDEFLCFHAPGCESYVIKLKYLMPIYKSDVDIDINGKTYTFFMTNDRETLRKWLKELDCLFPLNSEWKPNCGLPKKVMDKMQELGARWTLTTSHGDKILHYITRGVPYMVNIEELHKRQQKLIVSGAIANVIAEDNTEQLNKLVNVGSSFKFPNFLSWTPLMVAAYYNSVKSAELFIASGCDVNATSKKGNTALMVAASRNAVDVVRVLLKNGADKKILAENGWSAIIHAYTANNMEIVKLLSENGNEISQDIILAKTQWQPFPQKLSYYINRFTALGDKKPCDIYKNTRGFLSKQTFSKMQSTIAHPSKKNILLLSIGMKLALGETEDLLASAGLGFSESKQEDRIVRKFIGQRNYDIFEINDEIYRETKKNFFEHASKNEHDIEKPATFLIRPEP